MMEIHLKIGNGLPYRTVIYMTVYSFNDDALL